MTVKEIPELVDSYLVWLRDRTKIREVNSWVEVTTPYLDRHNDFIQIYVKKTPEGYLLTDDGITLVELEQAGCSISSPKRRSLFSSMLREFGLHEEDGAITARASEANFPVKKHMLLQGLLSIGDMFFLAQPTVATLFLEDVANWLSESEVRFTQSIKLAGRSGYDHVFDFVIPRSSSAPERLIRAFNTPDKNAANSMLLSWMDTEGARPNESKAYAVLNDSNKPTPASVVEALESYRIVPLTWTQREKYVPALAS